jgi:hypothetical protein
MTMRRHLKFRNLDDVLLELSALDGKPIITTGKWSFYQILNHLAEHIENSISQYPHSMPFVIRRTIGPMALRHLLKTQEMKSGVRNPMAPIQREEGDEKAAMLRLRKAIASFRAHDGPMAEHPFFGPINKEDYEALHAHHAALHLSFAHPQTGSREPSDAVSSPADVSAKKVSKKTQKKATLKKAPTAKKAPVKASRKTAKKSATEKSAVQE